MLNVKFNISKIDNADALNMIDEEMICERVEFTPGDLDTIMLIGTQDGNIGVEIDWIIEIKRE